MHIENCFHRLSRKLTNRSCSAEHSEPIDKRVQLFEIRSLLENNASYTQVFTVFLSRCLLLHLSQIYTDGIFIQNHLIIYAVKQCAQLLTFLVPVRLSFNREDSLTTMIQVAGFSNSFRNFPFFLHI